MQRSNSRIPSVHGWSYLTGEQVWLYDSHIAVSWREPRNISHGSACPPLTGSDFPGFTLETLWTSQFSSCVELCGARASCLGLTFITNICRLKYKIEERVPVTANIEIKSVTFNCSRDSAGAPHFDGLLTSINWSNICLPVFNVWLSGNFSILLVVASIPGTMLLMLITVSAVLTRTIEKEIIYVWEICPGKNTNLRQTFNYDN